LTDFITNPYAAPESVSELEVLAQKRRRTKTTFGVRVFCALFCGIVVIALALMAYQIESIVGTGAILSIIGIMLAIAGIRAHNFVAIVLGGTAPAFSMFIFGLIYTLEWSPEEAYYPVQAMSWCFAFLTIPVALWLLMRRAIIATDIAEEFS
jgi:membrane-bound ClpP family serine protease